MDVVPFTDQYAEVARLAGSKEALGSREPQLVALVNDAITGALRHVTRPDGRTFVRLVGPIDACHALLEVLDDDAPCLSVPEVNTDQVARARALGFTVEVTMEDFVLPFATIERFMDRSWLAPPLEMVSVVEVDLDDLALLDTDLRGAVPGVDGWVSDRVFVSDELDDPDFDPDAYLVARDGARLVGLVRVWRTGAGPKLGLVGVVPAYRRTTVAAALLSRALRAASTWGFEGVLAGATTANAVTHPLLVRLGAESLGRTLQMRRLALG